MSSALTRRHLLLGAAALPLLASNTALVGSAVAQSRTINVSNYGQLASAIGNARAGDVIVLANGGSFSGNRLTVAARGTASQPVVIRAQDLLRANVPNGFRLDGEHIILAGIDFAHSGIDVFVQIAGRHNTVEQCRFRAHGRHIQLLTGERGRVLYCEFSCPDKNAQSPHSRIIQTSFNQSTRHVGAEIGYCYFHNMPFKTSNYSDRTRVALGLGLSGLTSQLRTNHYVHHCLFEGTGDCELEVKTRYNRIEYCTMIGDYAQFNQRLGGNNVFRGCWAENNRGFEIMGDNNKLIGCKTVGRGCEFQIFAGNQSTTSTENRYPQAVDTVLAHCDGQSTVVGRTWRANPPMNMPATRTRLEAHSGPIRYGTHTGTVTAASSSEPRVQPVRLSRGAVGPAAKPYAVASAPSQPSDSSTQQAATEPAEESAPPRQDTAQSRSQETAQSPAPPAPEPAPPAAAPAGTTASTTTTTTTSSSSLDRNRIAQLLGERNGMLTAELSGTRSATFDGAAMQGGPQLFTQQPGPMLLGGNSPSPFSSPLFQLRR